MPIYPAAMSTLPQYLTPPARWRTTQVTAAVLCFVSLVMVISSSFLPLYSGELNFGISGIADSVEMTFTPWSVEYDDDAAFIGAPGEVPKVGYPLVFVAVVLACAAAACWYAATPYARPVAHRAAGVLTATASAFLIGTVWTTALLVSNGVDTIILLGTLDDGLETEATYLVGYWLLLTATLLGFAAAVLALLPTREQQPAWQSPPPAQVNPYVSTPPYGAALPMVPLPGAPAPLPPPAAPTSVPPATMVDPLTGQPLNVNPLTGQSLPGAVPIGTTVPPAVHPLAPLIPEARPAAPPIDHAVAGHPPTGPPPPDHPSGASIADQPTVGQTADQRPSGQPPAGQPGVRQTAAEPTAAQSAADEAVAAQPVIQSPVDVPGPPAAQLSAPAQPALFTQDPVPPVNGTPVTPPAPFEPAALPAEPPPIVPQGPPPAPGTPPGPAVPAEEDPLAEPPRT